MLRSAPLLLVGDTYHLDLVSSDEVPERTALQLGVLLLGEIAPPWQCRRCCTGCCDA